MTRKPAKISRVAMAAVSLSLVFTLPAMADCMLSQKQFEKEIASGKLEREQFSGVMKDVRLLRKAAAALTKYGKEDACEAVVEAMRELSSSPPQKAGLTPISDLAGQIRLDELLDAEIRASEGNVIGDVDDVLVSPEGQIEYVIVEYGGFLGMGEEQAAIPFTSLKITPNRDAYYIGLSNREFEKAPRFKRDSYDWVKDQDWKNRVNAYYRDNSNKQ